MDPLRLVQVGTRFINFVLNIVKEGQKLHYQLDGGLRFIKDELEMIRCDMPNNKEVQLELQELIYDVEDFVEDLWVPKLTGPILSAIAMNPNEKNLLRIKEYKERIGSLDRRRKKNMESGSGQSAAGDSSATTSLSSHSSSAAGGSPPHYTPEALLVGVKDPKNELLELLKAGDDDGSPWKKLKIISIVGCCGVGKTALARAVYEDPDVRHEFDCVAWFDASRCDDANTLLSMAADKDRTKDDGTAITTIPNIRAVPAEMRYLIFIDDVQQALAEVWKESIKEAFPQNIKGSRIIVTTSFHPVARVCSSGRYVYKMPRLCEADSTDLFWKKVQDHKPTRALVEGVEKILNISDGLPLALISVARYLASKGNELDRSDCEIVGEKLGKLLVADMMESKSFEELRRGLRQCYDSLPDYDRKACLLCLSIFPRGYPIKSKSLVRRLAAEGLVTKDGHECLLDLIDRCLVDLVQTCSASKVVKRCQVNGLFLEYIIEKSRSKNFLTLIRKQERLHKTDSTVARVRRLSIQSSTRERYSEIGDTSAIRYLTVLKSDLFDVRSCKMLRLLDLEGCKGLDNKFLECICKLRLLKYLCLRNSDIDMLPQNISNLNRLEMLDIRDTRVVKLSLEVITLPELAYLFGRFELQEMPRYRTEELKKFLSEKSKLHTLAGLALNGTQGIEQIIISMAKKLKKVKVWHAPRHAPSSSSTPSSTSSRRAFPLGLAGVTPAVSVLTSELRSLFTGFYALDSVSIDSDELCVRFLLSVEDKSFHFSSLKLQGNLSNLPDTKDIAKLLNNQRNLTKLQLISTGRSTEALCALETLSGLEYLKLAEEDREFFRGKFIVKEEGFESLKRLCIKAPEVPKLQFEGGGMQSLISLRLLSPNDNSLKETAKTVKGIAHLANLNEVMLDSSATTEAIQAWEAIISKHPNRPCVKKMIRQD